MADYCQKCGAEVLLSDRECSVCNTDAGFPNVRAASRPVEVAALTERYDIAVVSATARGVLAELKALEAAASSSCAVMNRSLGALCDWVNGQSELFLSFHKQVEHLGRRPNDTEWDQQRESAESTINPFYYRELNYAALTLDGTGIAAAFPFDVHVRVARASVLYRLGADQDALDAYSAVLKEHPYLHDAVLGKASLLIKLKNYNAAAELLPDTRPKTEWDWRRFVLRGILIERQGNAGAASRSLERGLASCPFVVERKSIRDALVSIELGRRRFRDARRLVEQAPEEVSNVVALHILAATQRPGLARKRLQLILNSPAPDNVIELANEIARRHRLVDGAPRHPIGWIADAEREYILVDAA
jgi:tetratricopeptide (TPR) repeat protein